MFPWIRGVYTCATHVGAHLFPVILCALQYREESTFHPMHVVSDVYI